MKNIKSIAGRIILLILGFGSLIIGGNYLRVDSSSLIEVQAEVISSSLEYGDESAGESYRVSYKYQVDGIQYEGVWSNGKECAPGEKIAVYYDPRSPGTSYSSRTETSFLYCGYLLFGFLCLGIFAWGVLKALFKKLKPASASTDGHSMESDGMNPGA